jgi:hypothetical protein
LRIATASGVVIPSTFELVTSVAAYLSVHASVDVVLADDTDGTTAWLDRTGNAHHYNNLGAASTLPLWNATDGPDGKACISGDGVARFINNTNWNPPAPGTTAMYWRAVARLNTWGSGNRHLWGGLIAARLALRTITSTPQVCISNTTASPSAQFTVGAWVLVEAYYSNSTSDFLKIGSAAAVTGTNVGNNDQASHALFSTIDGPTAQCLDASIAKLEIFAGLPSAGERAAMNASDTDFYGGAVTL